MYRDRFVFDFYVAIIRVEEDCLLLTNQERLGYDSDRTDFAYMAGKRRRTQSVGYLQFHFGCHLFDRVYLVWFHIFTVVFRRSSNRLSFEISGGFGNVSHAILRNYRNAQRRSSASAWRGFPGETTASLPLYGNSSRPKDVITLSFCVCFAYDAHLPRVCWDYPYKTVSTRVRV